jgi:hypothetical protein
MTVRQAFSVLDLENFVKFDAFSKSLPSRLELLRLHQQAGGSNRKGCSCGRSLRPHRVQGYSYHYFGTLSVVLCESRSDMGREQMFARVCYWMERQGMDSPSRCAAIAAWLNFAELLACRSFRSGGIGHVVGEGKTDVLEERCTLDGTDNRW